MNKMKDSLNQIDGLEILTYSPMETMAVGQKLAALLIGGEVLALEGELGAGKTHFIKGLALGLNYPDHVTSPTFNLIHEYTGGRLPLYHFDVYRLEDPAEIEGLGYEEYFYGQGVTAVEWSGIIEDYLPEEYVHISFQSVADTTNQTRRICIKPVGQGAISLIHALKQEVN